MSPKWSTRSVSSNFRTEFEINPLESGFYHPTPSPLEFSGALTPPPPRNFQFSPWRGYGYFLEPHDEEAINSSWNRIYSLKVFYFLLYWRRVHLLFLFLNWFSMGVSDNQKYVCGHRLYACINTGKFKGLVREITSSSEIKKVIYMARPFNHRQK